MSTSPSDEPRAGRFVGTTRLEAFSDGVIAIAITLLVLELAIPASGRPLERVLSAWPFFLAYVVSFLTIGAAWLAHNSITTFTPDVSSCIRPGSPTQSTGVRRTIRPVVVAYGTAVLIGLVLPAVAVGLYCVIAILLVVPFAPLARLLFPKER